ncbi:hypothetical protein TNCV_4409211 [Trichonephila clavipes]|nr:hypothetical protein TNCV_4409211 [Trichonephila clavipes]
MSLWTVQRRLGQQVCLHSDNYCRFMIRTPLVVIVEKLDGIQYYTSLVLRPASLFPVLGLVGIFFQRDNGRTHAVHHVLIYLNLEIIQLHVLLFSSIEII